MPTTIQLKNSTLDKLKKLKQEKKAKSYDEVIENLIKHELNLPESLFGFMKGKTNSFQRDKDDEDPDFQYLQCGSPGTIFRRNGQIPIPSAGAAR